MTAYWKSYTVKDRGKLRIYWRTFPPNFNPDPIWNAGALGFIAEVAPTRTTTTRTRWVVIWDQFLILTFLHFLITSC